MVKRDLIAAGIGLVATLACATLWSSSTPTPTPPAIAARREAPAATPAPAPQPAPAHVSTDEQDPLPGEPLRADPVEDPKVHARWQDRLAREDEALVRQAVAAGCDAGRAERLRAILAEKRQARARTVALRREGKLSFDELAVRARDTKRKADAALRALLTPAELAAFDRDGARASVIDVEKDRPR